MQALFDVLDDDGAMQLLQDSMDSASGPVRALLVQMAHKRVQAARAPPQATFSAESGATGSGPAAEGSGSGSQPFWLSEASARLFVKPVFLASQALKSTPTKAVTPGKIQNLLTGSEQCVAALNTLRLLCLRASGKLPPCFEAVVTAEAERLRMADTSFNAVLQTLQERLTTARTVMLTGGTPEAEIMGLQHMQMVTEHLLEICAPAYQTESTAGPA